jgi:proline iminopeptidase
VGGWRRLRRLAGRAGRLAQVFAGGISIRSFPGGAPAAGERLARARPAGFQQRIFELSLAAYFHDPDRARELTPFRVTGRTQQEVWSSLGDYDLRPRLPALGGIPSLILHGEEDAIPIEASRVAAELLGAEFHPVARCGHVPYVEAYEEFVRVVGGFLP